MRLYFRGTSWQGRLPDGRTVEVRHRLGSRPPAHRRQVLAIGPSGSVEALFGADTMAEVRARLRTLWRRLAYLQAVELAGLAGDALALQMARDAADDDLAAAALADLLTDAGRADVVAMVAREARRHRVCLPGSWQALGT